MGCDTAAISQLTAQPRRIADREVRWHQNGPMENKHAYPSQSRRGWQGAVLAGGGLTKGLHKGWRGVTSTKAARSEVPGVWEGPHPKEIIVWALERLLGGEKYKNWHFQTSYVHRALVLTDAKCPAVLCDKSTQAMLSASSKYWQEYEEVRRYMRQFLHSNCPCI